MPSGAECPCIASAGGLVLARHHASVCGVVNDGHAQTVPRPSPLPLGMSYSVKQYGYPQDCPFWLSGNLFSSSAGLSS